MDIGRTLLELLVILVVARLAAEGAERVRQPAVLGEIVLGILIGPSALALVHESDVLRTLGEIGAILLLFEVGRQMDLGDLIRVGGASLRVASIGVAVPMALGYVVMRAAGVASSSALYLAAGITATSVGITARVFGDLRALGTTEARTVLGAAVADDVIGLLILTVVTRVVAGNHLTVGSTIGIVGIAIGFVVGATFLGAWITPRILDGISARARTEGTVMALGLVVALGFARLASVAQLAPIVGAFVAGLAVGRSEVADDLHRHLTPLGHFFIPIFFLQIGIDTQLRVFAQGSVLWMATLLSIVAVVGKIAAGLGIRKGTGSRYLVGVGMIPRGEVGLIFASLGLTRGVLNAKTYAVLLLVVLVSTLITPPWIKRQIQRIRRADFIRRSTVVEPEGGWLRITDNEVEVVAEPPPSLDAQVGLTAAIAAGKRRPGQRLTDWLTSEASASDEAPTWDAKLQRLFFTLLSEGNERSWRFLDITGLLGRLLPELDAAIRRRPRDPFELDPSAALHWDILENLKALAREHDPAFEEAWDSLSSTDIVLLAAFVRSVAPGKESVELARAVATRIGLDAHHIDDTVFLVAERHLLPAAAARPDMGTEAQILDLASYIVDKELANGLHVLAVAENAMERWERERLDALYQMVVQVLEQTDVTGHSARELVQQREADVRQAMPELSESGVREHLWAAPRRYLLAQSPEVIVRHLRLTDTKPQLGQVRLEAERGPGAEEWTVHVIGLDRPGVLSSIAKGLSVHKVLVEDAQIYTWRNGVAVDVFKVTAPGETDWDLVRRTIESNLTNDPKFGTAWPPIDGVIDIDNLASPWHSIVEIQARDRAGLLYRVAGALARAGLVVNQATVTTRGKVAVDTFWVTTADGAKLRDIDERALRASFAGKKISRRLRLVRR